ncbi:MAG: LamG-like jellyroll fold domain-containing protein [Bacteroidota bacterium]|nr:LamG-like jellyroll fold domain-containing protein [Bacteroidota bacterium]
MKQFAFFGIALLMIININYAQINLDSCLVAYYPLDSIPIDYSPYSIEGNIINGAYSDTGKNNLPNTAFHFNGVNQYIDCDTNQREITNKVTVSAWINKTTISSDNGHVVTKYRGGNGTIQQGFHIVVRADGRPYFGGRLGQSGSPGFYFVLADEINVVDGAWHHLLGTVDQNEWNFWVDGYHIGTDIGNSPNPSLVCPDILSIGFYWEVQAKFFDGIIDEVRIYNRILNSDEISLLSDISFIDSTYLIQPDTQIINLPFNWSIFSTYIDPVYSDVDSVFVNNIPYVAIVKDGDGLIYWPQFSINSIGSLILGKGYQIKTYASQNLEIIGTQVQPELFTISLPVGWSIIGYLRDVPIPIDTVFSSMSNYINIIKNGFGSVYWPMFGLNMIGNMQPGQGYQIRMNTAQNLIYPANSLTFTKSTTALNIPTHFGSAKNTGSNMTLGIPLSAWNKLPATGDEVCVYTQTGLLVGSAVFSGDNMAITIWGDDELTHKQDGMFSGDNFVLKLFSQEKDIEAGLFVSNWFEGNAAYETNKISIIGKLRKPDQGFELYQNVPNPFNNETEFTYYLPEKSQTEFSIYNSLGERVIKLIDEMQETGKHSIKFDARNLPAGTYYFRIKSGNYTQTKRMALIR